MKIYTYLYIYCYITINRSMNSFKHNLYKLIFFKHDLTCIYLSEKKATFPKLQFTISTTLGLLIHTSAGPGNRASLIKVVSDQRHFSKKLRPYLSSDLIQIQYSTFSVNSQLRPHFNTSFKGRNCN